MLFYFELFSGLVGYFSGIIWIGGSYLLGFFKKTAKKAKKKMEEAFLCIKYAYLQKNKSEGEKKKKRRNH